MASSRYPKDVLLVGSIPATSAKEVFTLAAKHLFGSQLKRIPDGETGERSNWLVWQRRVFPEAITNPIFGGKATPEGSAKTYTLEDIKATGYHDAAIDSYKLFKDLKARGIIATETRFQVGLPTTFAVIACMIPNAEQAAKIEPLYEERMFQSICRIQEEIPSDELCIQLEIAVEFAMIETQQGRPRPPYVPDYTKLWFSPTRSGFLDRITKMLGQIKPGVEIGLHCCYGSYQNQHWLEPLGLQTIVDFANDISETVGPGLPIAYVHMPVPKDRKDAAYFASLNGLSEAFGEVYLGVVHANDLEGTKERIASAISAYNRPFGIASECGLGRTPKEEILSIFEIYHAITL